MTRNVVMPTALRCGYRVSPLGVEPDRVRFSWQLEGEDSSARQRAYQLVVRRTGTVPAADATLWDSGRVDSAESVDVAYGGSPLVAAARYCWEVRVWDSAESLSPWSAPAFFEVAKGDGAHWSAEWIGLGPGTVPHPVPSGPGLGDRELDALAPAPYFRREFALDKAIARARLTMTALGVYEATVNGGAVGEAVLAPGWTDYAKRCLYQTYDVTAMLLQGANALAVTVADGWACGFYGFDPKRRGSHYATEPWLLAELVVEYEDGSEVRVPTDSSWRSATGAVVHADLLMGERREFALEPVGWRLAGYDDASWRRVETRQIGEVKLVADQGPAIVPSMDMPARTITRLSNGAVVVDFGQNLVGWVELAPHAEPGTEVTVRHGEVLNADGSLYGENLRTARATDSYVVGGEDDRLAPGFTFHGFRYAEITGLGELPDSEWVRAVVVHSDTPRTGEFACSSDEVNQLFSNIDWSQRGNFLSVPTDCPQRDERLGWLGDAQIFVRTAAYNRDVAAFFTKWLDDVVDAQDENGAYADFAPRLGFGWTGAPAWGDAGVIVPWTMHKMYGDRGILERNLSSMAAWMDYICAHNPDYRRRSELGNNYGDWLAPHGDETPRELLATAYWAHDATLMAEIAELLGRDDLGRHYAHIAAETRRTFCSDYVSADGRVRSDTQTAYALALHLRLVPEDQRAACAAHLVEAIAAEKWRLATGFVGVGYVLPALSDHGYSDVAYRLLEQREYPSWLYPVRCGATTIWERWDGWTEARGFQSPRMNSFNHYSLGSVGEWLYRYVLGIDQAADSAGFARLVVRPHPGGSLRWASGSYRSVRGRIATRWAVEDSTFTLEVEVPPNVDASVHVPSVAPHRVVGPGNTAPATIAEYPGRRGAAEAVFNVGTGRWRFSGPALDATTVPSLDDAIGEGRPTPA